MNLPCRIIIVDADRQLAGAESTLDTAPAPLSRSALAEWGVAPRAAVWQLAAEAGGLRAVLPALAALAAVRVRIALDAGRELLVFLEIRAPLDESARAGIVELLQMATTALPATDGHPPPTAKTVVLVEDDAPVRSVCRRILQDRYIVVETSNGADALALADWLPWTADLLISDVNLPRMNGVELAARWLSRAPGTRLVLLSGSYFPEIAGALPAVFLQKPFQAEELLRCTELLVGRPHAASC